MPSTILYIAHSIDGLIAAPPSPSDPGGIDWLAPYADALAGFDAFLSSITTVLVGRTTWDFMLDHHWHLGDRTVHVITSRPLNTPPHHAHRNIRPLSPADLLNETRTLRQAPSNHPNNNIWIVGGARLIRDLHTHQLIDRYHLFTIPTFLAAGTPLFTPSTPPPTTSSLKLEHLHHYPSGVIESIYTRATT